MIIGNNISAVCWSTFFGTCMYIYMVVLLQLPSNTFTTIIVHVHVLAEYISHNMLTDIF